MAEIVWATLAALISLYYLLRWSFPPLYWLTAVVIGAFAAAFDYFYFKHK